MAVETPSWTQAADFLLGMVTAFLLTGVFTAHVLPWIYHLALSVGSIAIVGVMVWARAKVVEGRQKGVA